MAAIVMSEIEDLREQVKAQQDRIQRLEKELILIRGVSALDRESFVPILNLAMIVQEKTGISIAQMRSDRQDNKTVQARFILIHLACTLTRLSTARIGRFLNRDHTSIMSGRDRIKTRIEANPSLKSIVDMIELSVRERHFKEMPIDHPKKYRESPELARAAGFEPAP